MKTETIKMNYNSEVYELYYNDGFIWCSGMPNNYIHLFTAKVFKTFAEAGFGFYHEVGAYWYEGVNNGFSLEVSEKSNSTNFGEIKMTAEDLEKEIKKQEFEVLEDLTYLCQTCGVDSETYYTARQEAKSFIDSVSNLAVLKMELKLIKRELEK